MLGYNDLARLMGPEQPFYGLQSRGLSGTEKPLTSIEDIAAAFLGEIREVRPEGPYYLVGACMGGIVAYEMAQQLRAAGHEVGLLILLETWLPVTTSERRLRPDVRTLAALHLIVSRLRLYVQTLARLRGRQRFDYLLERLKILGRWSPNAMCSGVTAASSIFRLVTQANRVAVQQYQPRVYPGRVVLFRAEDRKVASGDDLRRAWSRLAAGGLEIHSLSADDSGALLREPHVRVLARQLKACIECVHGPAATVERT